MFWHYLISPLRRCVERFSSRSSDFSSFFSDFSEDGCVLGLRGFSGCCVVGVRSVVVLPDRTVLAEAGAPRTPVYLIRGRGLGCSSSI
jgi:hypothetical protein